MDEDNELNLDSSIDEIAAGVNTDVEPEGAAPASPAPGTALAAPAAPSDEWATPPKSWRQEVHPHWSSLPAEVRAEVARRESDILKGIQQYKTGHESWSKIDRVMAPYKQIMQQYGVGPEQVIAPLLEAHHTLVTGTPEAKAARLRAIAKNYGLESLLAGESEQPWKDPALGGLESKLSQIEQVQNAILAQARNEAVQSLNAQVNDFAKDKPDFDELLEDIIPLVQGGLSLEDAYARAQWSNPVAREKLLVKEREALKAKLEAERQTTGARSSRHTAARIGPTNAPGKPTAPTGSIDETLEETFRSIQSR